MATLFPLGDVVAMPRALEALGLSDMAPADLLARHVTADWGDVGEEDRACNDQALQEDERLCSAYDTPRGRVLVRTSPDRSFTDILLPEENERLISLLLSGTPNAQDELEREELEKLSLRDRGIAAILVRAGEAATVEEAMRSHRERVEANVKANERRRGFKVME